MENHTSTPDSSAHPGEGLMETHTSIPDNSALPAEGHPDFYVHVIQLRSRPRELTQASAWCGLDLSRAH